MREVMLKPYKFKAYLKETIWGGRKLASFKGIKLGAADVGESWEISAVEGHESVVAEGVDKGCKLNELIEKYGARLVGQKVYDKYGTVFPLLIKFIDAAQDLSIQVHPNDKLAALRHKCRGKTEMWYVIDAEEGAKVYSGLRCVLTPKKFEELVARGGAAFEEVLACHASRPGAVFFLPAGRVHAIGAGNLVAEIQETSDITYRVYDYDRVGADGRKRELHTDLAKEAIDYRVLPEAEYVTAYDERAAKVSLVECAYFKVARIRVEGEERVDLGTKAFVVVMCLAGSADVNGVCVRQGETLLVPAEVNVLSCRGCATFLTATM